MRPVQQATGQVRVELGERSYDVLVGARLVDSLGERMAAAFGPGRRAFLVYDGGLPDEVVIAATRSLAHHGFQVSAASVSAEEGQKTLGTVARLLVDVAETKHERGDPVVALGGGVAGDVAGFMAAVYRRGVPVVQVPTTLLAMVDASVGGKTGVNLLTAGGLVKNAVGAFWQPRLVVADVSLLATLPERELRSGLAECIKHGMVGALAGDDRLFDWMTGVMPRALARDEATLAELVARNVAVKARIVERDEREGGGPDGGRALVNLGHTFGHALETLAGVSVGEGGQPTHGEAVGLGLLAASVCGEAVGITEAGVRPAVWAALRAAGLPTGVRMPATEAVVGAMLHDKKAAGGKLRLVLPTKLGHAVVVTGPPMEAVSAGIEAVRA